VIQPSIQPLIRESEEQRLCPFISVKGDFEDTPDAVISRAQRPKGGKATFGLKVVESKDCCKLGTMMERGFFDYRWPFNRYQLEIEGSQVGTCTIFSCFQDKVLCQVMRIESEIKCLNVSLAAGGRLRFGCMCSALEAETYHTEWSEDYKQAKLLNDALPNWSFSMEVTGADIIEPSESDGGSIRTGLHYSTHQCEEFVANYSVSVPQGQSQNVIAMFSLGYVHSKIRVLSPAVNIQKLAQIGFSSARYKSYLWQNLYPSLDIGSDGHTDVSWSEPYLVARCLEKVLSVNFIHVWPVRGGDVGQLLYAPVTSLLPFIKFNFQEIL
jgi:hypothetical protein